MDDLATGGHNHKGSAANTAEMFAMLKKRGLKAGADKIFMGLTELKFLGYLIKDGKLYPDPDKVEAIKRLLPPTTRSEVRSFLGLTGYYREFVQGYSQKARPLTDLLKEDTPWEWTPARQRAFDTLRDTLATSPVLAMP